MRKTAVKKQHSANDAHPRVSRRIECVVFPPSRPNNKKIAAASFLFVFGLIVMLAAASGTKTQRTVASQVPVPEGVVLPPTEKAVEADDIHLAAVPSERAEDMETKAANAAPVKLTSRAFDISVREPEPRRAADVKRDQLKEAVLFDRAGESDEALALYRQILDANVGDASASGAIESIRRRADYLASLTVK